VFRNGCHIKHRDSSTVWTDNQTGLTVQVTSSFTSSGDKPVRSTVSAKTTSLALNEPIAESLFAFNPPASAKEAAFDTIVPRQTAGPPAAFDAKALDGTSYNVSSLKGKSVLLVFWATWCRPCRDAAAAVNAVRRDINDDAFVILGVDPVEPAETVERFLKSSPELSRFSSTSK
jgi:thiol-disulfide isomerase/thioredoxin